MSLTEIIISMCVIVSNNRVQILTEELKYHSMLGIGLFTSPGVTLQGNTRQSVGVRCE